MPVTREQFAAFFAAVHGGHLPFCWQERLLDQLLQTGTWPQQIVAPTGAGKTAAIDVHVFAVALTAGGSGVRLPRRLAMVVGRRVLVDDQHAHASHVARLLADPGRVADADHRRVLRAVAERLWSLHGSACGQQNTGEGPLVVGRLRGGAPPQRAWRDEPTACAVLCATPDMWGSRLLFGGYGSARLARPREAGLLALDTAVVVDEAHLSRQLLATARRVAQLCALAPEPVGVPTLQVVETTATPDDQPDRDGPSRQVGVTEDDLAASSLLAARLTRPKPVHLVPVKQWPPTSGDQRRKVAAELADQAVTLLREPETDDLPHTIGCYVNTVAMAVETARALRRRQRPDGGVVRVVTICGQVRPADLDRLAREHDGLLTLAGNHEVDVLVTTQSLEVGVDLDLAAVVSELASWSALAQRAGRANRSGRRAAAPVQVIVPAKPINDRVRSGPYQHTDLQAAMDRLQHREQDLAGMAPWALRTVEAPAATSRRPLLQRPELADAWHWARTSDELAADPQLELWLTEDFEPDLAVGLVVREAMPAEAADAIALTRLLPPRDRETFAVPIRTARAILADALRGDEPPLAIRVRGEDTAVLDPQRLDLRPGDVIIVDSTVETFTPSTSDAMEGFSPPVPVPPDEDDLPVSRARAQDVLHQIPQPGPGEVTLRMEPAAWDPAASAQITALLKELAGVWDELAERPRRRRVAQLLEELAPGLSDGPRAGMLAAAVRLLRQPVKLSDLHLHRDAAGEPIRMVLVDRRRAGADERIRQTWTPREDDQPVLLDDHQQAVAERATTLGDAVGLPAALIESLRLAGAHHDDGKADPRFQVRLGADPTGAPWAKSRPGQSVTQTRRLANQCGLPSNWRHEQLSVSSCWHEVQDAAPGGHAPLVTRLVGTSHGHGRSTFPRTAAELIDAHEQETHLALSEELFDLGGWDELIERTHLRWGVWGCAYLEALLRAADGQVSAEGR